MNEPTKRKRKYNNNITYWHIPTDYIFNEGSKNFEIFKGSHQTIRFDSHYEAQLYRMLHYRYSKDCILTTQEKILILPTTKNQSSVSYRPDITIRSKDRVDVIAHIDAKGLKTQIFNLKLKIMACHLPDVYDKLLIVYKIKQKNMNVNEVTIHEVVPRLNQAIIAYYEKKYPAIQLQMNL